MFFRRPDGGDHRNVHLLFPELLDRAKHFVLDKKERQGCIERIPKPNIGRKCQNEEPNRARSLKKAASCQGEPTLTTT